MPSARMGRGAESRSLEGDVEVKMQFDKSGRRFFFLTFAVQGRRKVLSRVEEREGMAATVELSAAGEAVAALWKGVHGRWPHLTASNRVVMPDHVHLLLIVDYRQAPGFDILGWFKQFLREAAEAVGPMIGEAPERVWEERYWLVLLNAGRPLASVRRYIRANPDRWVWKRRQSDFFARRGGLRHFVLDSEFSWTGVGNLTLLDSPFLFPVRLTRRLTTEEHGKTIERAVERARRGMIPVCGFLSPGEKALEERLREDPCARWIKTVPHGLADGFDPSVEDSRALAEGRLLVLSSFGEDVEAFPVRRENCEAMNERNAAMCARGVAGCDRGRAPCDRGRAPAPPCRMGEGPHAPPGRGGKAGGEE